MISNLNIKTNIHFGEESFNSIQVNGGKCCLIINPKMPENVLQNIQRILINKKCDVQVLNFCNGEPDSIRVNIAYSSLANSIPDFIVAIGGGSLIDFAKALSILFSNGGKIEEYEFGERQITHLLPLYVMPSVYGSGSEVTPYAVINNSISGRKFTLSNSNIQPTAAFIDSNIKFFIPRQIEIVSGIDAFIHCLEALLSRQSSLLIKPFASQGIKIGWNILSQKINKVNTYSFEAELALISLFGGISISHCRTGLIHTLSVAFAKYLPLPHGLLNAVMVKYALSHNLPYYNGLLAKQMNDCLNTSFETDQDAYLHLQHWFDDLILHLEPDVKFIEVPDADKIVNRLMQDKGLQGVSHGPITEEHLKKIVNKIIYENR